MSIKGLRSSASMKDILELSKQLYEPISNKYLNDSSAMSALDNSKSTLLDKSKSDKSERTNNYSSGNKDNTTLIKNIFSKGAGEVLNQIYYDNTIMKNKSKPKFK